MLGSTGARRPRAKGRPDFAAYGATLFCAKACSMVFRFWQTRIAAMLVGVGTIAAPLASQDMPHRATVDILRQQLGDIADEIAGRLQFPAQTAVRVLVQPSPNSGLAENAFVGTLQHDGFRTFVGGDPDSAGFILVISILTDDARYKKLDSGRYGRTVETELEARTQKRSGEAIAVLGTFHRAFSDTVSAKDAELMVPRARPAGDEETSFFERFVGPLIVLASGIVIVYLFFTVRS